MNRQTWWHVALTAATLALALAGASSALAGDAPVALDCTIRFQLKGWSAVYEHADGTGTVSCADGTSMPVVIHARGAGLSLGKSNIEHGTGKFSDVHKISDVLGSYGQTDLHAGVVKSASAQLLTKGKVSVALAGTGDGVDLGIGLARFTITKSK